jgi:hypothetical protein
VPPYIHGRQLFDTVLSLYQSLHCAHMRALADTETEVNLDNQSKRPNKQVWLSRDQFCQMELRRLFGQDRNRLQHTHHSQ